MSKGKQLRHRHLSLLKQKGVTDAEFFESGLKSKKYRVEFTYKRKRYKINFGSRKDDQYKDSTPLQLYKTRDHYDETRKDKFLSRARGITDKEGNLTYNNPLSANFWAINFLW